jgi:hypothetical protein
LKNTKEELTNAIELNAGLTAKLTEVELDRDSLRKQLAEQSQKLERWAVRFETARLAYEERKKEIALLRTQVEEFKASAKAFQDEVSRLKKLGPELIGLKGKMRRVVILFDSSASMNERGRWADARSVVDTWLEHLSVDQCALVVFGKDIEIFPRDGSLLEMQGDIGAKNRTDLIGFLKDKKPEGGTNTLKALERAYKYPGVDTIVLLTDGAPNNGNSVGFDLKSAKDIYKLCGLHKDIPINAVGLGDYFKGDLSTFLLNIAQLTNGTFLGR